MQFGAEESLNDLSSRVCRRVSIFFSHPKMRLQLGMLWDAKAADKRLVVNELRDSFSQ